MDQRPVPGVRGHRRRLPGPNPHDGSYYDLKTRLLKESDVVEGGTPYKFFVHDDNWEALAPRA
ncbi:MAG: hypothetical protein V8S24_04445 [Gordonibacter pamelaeae]